jgi:hypothetical protein
MEKARHSAWCEIEMNGQFLMTGFRINQMIMIKKAMPLSLKSAFPSSV